MVRYESKRSGVLVFEMWRSRGVSAFQRHPFNVAFEHRILAYFISSRGCNANHLQ